MSGFSISLASHSPLIFTSSGTANSTTVPSSIAVPGLAQETSYRVTVKASPGSALNAVVKIKNPSGVTILTQNTGFDEDVSFTTTVAGTYMVETTAFNANAGGDYVLIVYALNELYLWHGDEIIHGGVHRWKAQNVGTKQYRTATAPLGGNVSIP